MARRSRSLKRVLFCRLVRNRVEKLLELLASLVAEGEPMPGINVVRYVVGRVVGEPDLSLIVLPYLSLRRIING